MSPMPILAALLAFGLVAGCSIPDRAPAVPNADVERARPLGLANVRFYADGDPKPLIDDGRVIGLAVSSAQPWFNLPNIPTLASLGMKDFIVPGWNGLMAPKGTPPAVIAKLSAALAGALHTEASTKAFNTMGFKPGEGTPERMRRDIEADMHLFTTVIRERNLKFDT